MARQVEARSYMHVTAILKSWCEPEVGHSTSSIAEVALRLEQGERRSLAALAAELGYTDRAHLTRDFKSAVGKSPRQFATLVHK